MKRRKNTKRNQGGNGETKPFEVVNKTTLGAQTKIVDIHKAKQVQQEIFICTSRKTPSYLHRLKFLSLIEDKDDDDEQDDCGGEERNVFSDFEIFVTAKMILMLGRPCQRLRFEGVP